ncbi:MAG: beta strand repeat-containing protein [Steroidobacteraceae bacterium]
MHASRAVVFSTARRAGGWMLAAPLGAALLALTACSGTAVVTMTSTASPDNFLAYRVGLVAVQLQTSSGGSGLTVLPASTTVDFATLTDLSEVLGAASVAKGTYTSALITLDYSAAQIVYDDGSVNGLTLTPVGANGQALGQVQIKLILDPGDPFSIAPKGASQLALEFNLAASNVVNAAAKTVTVTPLIAGSALPIDAKPVRIRGPLASVAGIGNATAANASTTSGATGSGSFTLSAMPFNSTASGGGQLAVILGDLTTYEINGGESTGAAGQGQLAAVGTGALTVAYGILANDNQITLTTTAGGTQSIATTAAGGTQSSATPNTVSFFANQVLAGSSVQGSGLDRVSGIVAARSGNTLAVEDATLVSAAGIETFLGGTTTVLMSANTLVTVFGQGGTQLNSTLQVSVGSAIDAFGVATIESADSAILDASAGRVRLDTTTASGLVTAQGVGALNLNLAFLGGRAIAPFNFVGSGVAANQYGVNTGIFDLTNSTPGVPVIVSGLTPSFGAPPLEFTAATLLDPTTIQAELVVDYGSGTAAPFTTYNGSAIDVDIHNASIGARHLIQVGAQTIDVLGLATDASIIPDPTASNTVFTIGHAASTSAENFDTFAAFIAQVQTELQGATLATGVTAVGQYTASTSTLSATSVTLFLNH